MAKSTPIRIRARKVVLRLALGFVTVILAALIGQFAIQVASDKGVYEHAGQRWDSAVSAILAFLTMPVFTHLATLAAGIVIALWLDVKVFKAGQLLPATGGQPSLTDTGSDLPNDASLPRFERAPPLIPTDEDGFDYAYPKAVLQARIKLEAGTRLARAGDEPHRMELALTVENKHRKILRDCTVFLIGLVDPDGEETIVNAPFHGADKFNLDPRSPRNFIFLTRDISDKVTPGPFLLRTAGPGIPLRENSTYFAVIDLECRYPHPTKLGIQIDTKQGLDARAVIVEQKLEAK